MYRLLNTLLRVWVVLACVETLLLYGAILLCPTQRASELSLLTVLLFAVIGTTFGVGDGSTPFNLPNLAAPVSGVKYIIKV